MKLYQTPGGTWAGSEKDWKAAMKAEGADPKAMTRNTVDVPTSKADLMEFLTFNNVNVLCPRSAGTPQVAPAADIPPAPLPGGTLDTHTVVSGIALERSFEAAPIGQKLTLATVALDAAIKELAPR